MEVALEGPNVHLRLADQPVHGVAVGGGQKRLADVQQAQLHMEGAGLHQVSDQLGLRNPVAGSQGDHLERDLTLCDRWLGTPRHIGPAELEFGDADQANERSAAGRVPRGLGKLDRGGATRGRTNNC